MIISKIKDFFKSFRNKVIVIIALIAVTGSLLISKYMLSESTDQKPNSINIPGENNQNSNGKIDPEHLKSFLSQGVDSVLRNFGVKSEWVTLNNEEKPQKKPAKNESKDASLFSKNILIPNDLTSIEVNAELNSFFNHYGFFTSVYEDIITKDVMISVNEKDTASGKLPLIKLNIIHSDKVHRESAIVCVIINNITDYENEEIDKLLMNKQEFSFVFPRNLDEIDLQNKLLHHKKDVIINLTVGQKENYETDFNASMDEKAVRERVKSFSVDFPTVTTVILTRKDNDINPAFITMVQNELNSFKIRVINDHELSALFTKAEEEAGDKYGAFASNLKTKGSLAKSIVTSIAVNKDDFEKFYDEVLKLKKLGYKFYNFAEFSAKKDAFEKAENEKQEKIKEEQQKKQNEKKIIEKKQTEKKQTDVKKKTDVKKPIDKKKTEPKKKSDVKKK